MIALEDLVEVQRRIDRAYELALKLDTSSGRKMESDLRISALILKKSAGRPISIEPPDSVGTWHLVAQRSRDDMASHENWGVYVKAMTGGGYAFATATDGTEIEEPIDEGNAEWIAGYLCDDQDVTLSEAIKALSEREVFRPLLDEIRRRADEPKRRD